MGRCRPKSIPAQCIAHIDVMKRGISKMEWIKWFKWIDRMDVHGRMRCGEFDICQMVELRAAIWDAHICGVLAKASAGIGCASLAKNFLINLQLRNATPNG
jgi:hypothetical protein